MSLVTIAASIKTQRIKLTQSTGLFTLIAPSDPGRWSLVFVSRTPSTSFVTPFPGDVECPGIALVAGKDEWFGFSRHPGLVGLAWYLTTFDPIVPATVVECWVETYS